MIRRAVRLLARLWALPVTVLGLVLLPLAWAGGGRTRVVQGVIEAEGGWVAGFLRRWPPFTAGAAAMTLGHVVLAMSPRDMDEFRAHERVHVRQCERWGVFFLPAYVASSLWALLKGMDPYRDNAFEREAFERAREGARSEREV